KELPEEDQRQQKRELGQPTSEKGRRDSIREAAEQSRETDEIGLVLPAQVAGACEERRIESHLRSARQPEDALLHEQRHHQENELGAGANGEPRAGRWRPKSNQLAGQSPAQAREERIVNRRHGLEIPDHSPQDRLMDSPGKERIPSDTRR